MPDERPDIADVTSGAELKDWYWLKSELEDACRVRALSRQGSKAVLTDRLAHFLDTGEALRPKPRGRSGGFNWAKDQITCDTLIDEGYSNGPNTRSFFEREIGPRFRFTIPFMAWMKANAGRSMADAVDEWRRQRDEKSKGARQAIPASNQWNAYLRAFFAANPERSVADARTCWAAKRARRGHNRYEDADLAALSDP
ncbi:MAG: DUF6434 domain-containing protein [Pseudomonadota bacterium]